VEAAAASRPSTGMGHNQRIIPGSRAAVSSNAFPGLGAASGSRQTAPHSTPWASGGAGTSSKAPPVLAGPQIRSVNFPLPKAQNKPPSQGAFPSLPASSKPSMSAQERKALFSKPTGRSANEWDGGASEGVEGMNINGNGSGEGDTQQGGKKKGKQKQILFSVSARPQ
jgi:hypothetical protein